ncbi:hypothetical protein DAKH74_000540 [Maudiozyma humilis]|uniref:Uncharacterized protein n=1 Tax=Maudiozyma humilis TaxID=51915 RepID=A0AAV5RQE7_MAUHU|nr:hypothetical protein DAKH74_000540 [Kazachstania humilis]
MSTMQSNLFLGGIVLSTLHTLYQCYKFRVFPFLGILVVAAYSGYIFYSTEPGMCPLTDIKRVPDVLTGELQPSLLQWECSQKFVLYGLFAFNCMNMTTVTLAQSREKEAQRTSATQKAE